ncbi:MAG: dihydrodipicolinate reductase [Pseudomonadota bacterium]
MNPIKVMVNGLPGNMATKVAEHALHDNDFQLLPYSLTGPEITDTETVVGSVSVRLIRPEEREDAIAKVQEAEGPLIAVDYTHPSSVNSNASFYCEKSIPFVMGTTGGDREGLTKVVEKSSIPAVIAPNMAKQIVGFQAMMEFAAKEFPDLFKGYSLEIVESHQKGKADTSGTAKAMVGYFNRLGVPFSKDNIQMIREPAAQQSELGVPEDYLTGHGWHTYTLISEDGTVRFQFVHNVNGRDVYALGTLDAIRYLAAKVEEGITGRVFTMIDVLKGI